jgi:two-component system, sensor histidine kinase YesM
MDLLRRVWKYLSVRYLNLGIRQKLLISYVVIISIIIVLISYINIRISTAYLISSARDRSNYLLDQVSKDLEGTAQGIIDDVFDRYTASNLNRYEREPSGAAVRAPTPEEQLRYTKGLSEIAYADLFIQYAVFIKAGQRGSFVVKKDIGIPDYDVASNRGSDEPRLIALRGRPLLRSGGGSTVLLLRALYDTIYLQYLGYLAVGIDTAYFARTYQDVDREKVGSIVVRDREGAVILYDSPADLDIIRDAEGGLAGSSGTTGLVQGRTRYLVQSGRKFNQFLEVINILPIDRISSIAATLRLWTTAAALVAMAIASLVVAAISGSISANIRVLLESVRAVSDGDFSQRIVPNCRDEVGQLAEEFNTMSSKVSGLMARIIREKRRKQHAEYLLLESRYKMLQARMNPHFLYNVLETINSRAILEGNSRVSFLVCQLAKMLRRSLQRRKALVTLKDEIDYVRDYLSMYTEIYGDRIGIVYRLDPSLDRTIVPCFIMLPVVENAIVHGLENKMDRGTIRISSMLEGDRVVLEVNDDGAGMPAAELRGLRSNRAGLRTRKAGTHVREGLRSVTERIRLLYGSGYGVRISSKAKVGTTVRIYLPRTGRAVKRPELLRADG